MITRLRVATGIAWLAGFALLGCNGDSVPTASAGAALTAASARDQWNSVRPASYAFVAVRACECLAHASGPVRVVVTGGAVTSVRMVEGDDVDAALWFTIDGLFDLIDAEFQRLPERLEASFDATRGFPTRVSYGEPERDAGAIIEVRSFEVR